MTMSQVGVYGRMNPLTCRYGSTMTMPQVGVCGRMDPLTYRY